MGHFVEAQRSISSAIGAEFCCTKVQKHMAHNEEGIPNGKECHILGVVGSNALCHAESGMPLRGDISKLQAYF